MDGQEQAEWNGTDPDERVYKWCEGCQEERYVDSEEFTCPVCTQDALVAL